MHVLDELHARGFIQQITDEDALRSAIDAGGMSFYVGFDPTANSLHVGNLLPMMKAAHLQRAGLHAIALAGGGTGRVGDPSGKTEARQLLDEAAIDANVEAIREQLGRVIDLADPSKGELVDNADWLLSLNYIAFLREIGREFSVNRMLTAEGFRQRLEREQGLSFIEFNYQLLQAYDYLHLFRTKGVRLQIGGDDQWGNLLAGVDLVRRKERTQVFASTLPLLTTATGAKMGKTHKGALWLSAERTKPFDFYQYWINVDDRDVERFLKVFTFLPLDEIAELAKATGPAIRDVKHRLAWEVTALIHGAAAADEAKAGAAAMVKGEAADDLPTHTVPAAELAAGVALFSVLRDAGLVKSGSEARRMLQQGAVKIDGEKVDDVETVLTAEWVGADGVVVRVGKKRAARVVAG